MAYRRNTFGLNAHSGGMDSRSELGDLSRSARVGTGSDAPAKMRGWEVYHGWVGHGEAAEERGVGRSHAYSKSFWKVRHWWGQRSGTGIRGIQSTRRHELVGTPTAHIPSSVAIRLSIRFSTAYDSRELSGAEEADDQVTQMGELKIAVKFEDVKHGYSKPAQLAGNLSEKNGQTRIRARHSKPKTEVSLFFDCLATKITYADFLFFLKTKLLLLRRIFVPPLHHCAHYRSMQSTPNQPRPRRSLLPRKYPMKPNDDAAEKRLRRQQVALELERRKEEKLIAPTPEAEESEEMKTLAAGIQRYLDDNTESPDSSVHSVMDSVGGTREHQDSREEQAAEEQAARNWEIWVRCVLGRMNRLDRQQLLRDWRDQEERERRWEAAREYADDLPSGTADYVEYS
ncbi:hypothetical protein R3P38DRAFT_3239328 [Favolaschia claudopus]|uniref:Uncharacterized protein n=1 Tax=Favolaschia claudopus TaxID=2862362 RepID=A0AAV9Z867_9AGAR